MALFASLLGMLYFYDICKDEELKGKIIGFVKAQADYILEHIGYGKLLDGLIDVDIHFHILKNLFRFFHTGFFVK